jgi:GNAT superfamily N-acetyltransferase
MFGVKKIKIRNMISFKLLTESNKADIIPFLSLLNEKIGKDILESRLTEMFTQGYQCVGIYKTEKLVGICGLWIITKYYVGRHIEPDNVIIHPDHRGEGIGEALMQWIYDYAIAQNCIASELNCYVTNHGGQKFWINQGYKVIGFHYQKTLTPSS